MFNSKLFFSLAVFTFFLIITSLVKNQSRVIEKQIKGLNINIIAKEALRSYISSISECLSKNSRTLLLLHFSSRWSDNSANAGIMMRIIASPNNTERTKAAF